MWKIHGNVELAGILALLLVSVAALVLQSCTGTKLLKDPIPVEGFEPLTEASDDFVKASLNWVVVRDGPGAWTENADWDEYWITVSNQSEHNIHVKEISIIDLLQVRIKSSSKRSELVRNSTETLERYEDSDIEVTAGFGAMALFSASAASGAAGVAAINALGVFSSGAGLVAIATIIAVPALAAAGIYRGINDRKVSKAIEARHTEFPLNLNKGDTKLVKLFYPLAPSPKRLEIRYTLENESYTMIIDTTTVLNGLHIMRKE